MNMISVTGMALLSAFWPFASGVMLWWGLAALIPLAIHFLSRRRYDEVPWAAMKFLLTAIRKNARRWRLEQLALLALRVLILLLLAVALADPIWPLFGAAASPSGSAGDAHVVVVIDASFSMDYRHADGTRFDAARQLAGELVKSRFQGDGFSLILLAAPPVVVVGDPVFDREDLAAEIAELQRTDGGADLAATLAEIERVVDRTARREPRLLRRRVCFFTDLGLTTWGAVSEAAVQGAVARLADKADLQLVDLGEAGGQNVAVTRVVAAEGIVTVGTPTRIDIEVENLGDADRPRHGVEVLVGGQRISQEQLDVPAGGRATTAIVHRFQIPGEQIVEVLTASDPLEVDNHRWLSLSVRPALEVLCVEGKSGAARHVALALEPGTSQQSQVRPSVQSEIALLEEDLSRYDCLFLCNVRRFGRDEAGLLRQFLEQGGGVVMCLGDQVQAQNYNSILGAATGGLQILPAHLGDPVPLGEYFFDPLEYRHPIVEPFRGHERAGLLTTPIWKYVKLEPFPGDDVRTALAFENQDPAVLEASVGRGHVIVLATDAASTSVDATTDPPTPWSALAAWPSFPPLVQQMLRSAVRGRVQLRNAMVGDVLRGAVPGGLADASVVLTDPAGRSQRLSAEGTGSVSEWTFTDTARSGVYTGVVGGTEGTVQRYAVNVDTRESRLERLDPELLPRAIQRGASDTAFRRTHATASHASQSFRYLLAGVLLLLLSETLLAWLFGRSAAHAAVVS
ncbi:MAG: VWA domain-containing protein [Planctomycetaceae bacterium]|nr:VWA domain-containing protein [Planctomycetaceae bacterium]